MSFGRTTFALFTVIVLKSADRLINAAGGKRVAATLQR